MRLYRKVLATALGEVFKYDIDMYFDNNTLLITGESGFNNETDYGDFRFPANYPISTLSPRKVGKYSLNFAGTGNGTVSGECFKFGTADFTVQAYMWPLSAGSAILLDCRPASTNGAYLTFALDASIARVNILFGGTNHFSVTTLEINQWSHVAYCRRNGVGYLFINGVLDATWTDATNYTSVDGVYVARGAWTTSYANMYADQICVTRGIARYIENFTPPVNGVYLESYSRNEFDPYAENVTALIDGNTFTDSAGNVITPGGTGVVVLSNARPKFWTASLYSPITTYQYCVYNNSAAFVFPADFTVECWVKLEGISTTQGMLIDCRNGVAGNKFCFGINSGAFPFVNINGTVSTSTVALRSTTWTISTWRHIAVSRIAGTLYIFVDGKLGLTLANSTSFIDGGNVKLFASSMSGELTGAYTYHGWFSNLRVTAGVGRYQTAFTPTQRPAAKQGFKQSATNDFYWQKTVLLAHLNNDAANASYGGALTENAITYTSSPSRFGGNSAGFNGSSSYIDGMALTIGLLDFTLDGFGYQPASANNKVLFTNGGADITNAGGTSWWLGSADTGDATRLAYGKPGLVTYSATGVIPLNTWFHWSLQRRNGTITGYINGLPVLTVVDAALNMSSPTGYVCCIGNQNKTTDGWNGNLAEVRLATLISRYTKQFTVPTSRYPEADGFVTYATAYGEDIHSANVAMCIGHNATTPYDYVDNDLEVHNVIPATWAYVDNAGGFYNGTTSYLSKPYKAAMDVGSSDFTYEGFFNFSDVTAFRALFASETNFRLGCAVSGGYLRYYASSNGTSWDLLDGLAGTINGKGSTVIRPNQLYHFAFVRSGNDWYGFVNGKLDLHVVMSGAVVSRAEALVVGRWGDGTGFAAGTLEKSRLTRAARYIEPFVIDAKLAVVV